MHNTVVEFLYHNWYTRRRVFSAAMLVWIFTSYHIHYTEQAKKPVASATAVTGFVTVLHNDPAAHKDYCLEDTGFELEYGTTARTRDYVMLGQCAVPSYRKRGCVIIHLVFLY